MYPAFADITDRIADPPAWFDVHGTPRYQAFHPGMLGVHDKVAALFEVGCQSCAHTFLIGVGWVPFDITMIEVIVDPAEGRTAWVPLSETAWVPANARRGMRTASPAELFDRFYFGDAPSAGPHRACTGTTMNSDGPVLRQAWTRPSDIGWVRDRDSETAWWALNGTAEDTVIVAGNSTWVDSETPA